MAYSIIKRGFFIYITLSALVVYALYQYYFYTQAGLYFSRYLGRAKTFYVEIPISIGRLKSSVGGIVSCSPYFSEMDMSWNHYQQYPNTYNVKINDEYSVYSDFEGACPVIMDDYERYKSYKGADFYSDIAYNLIVRDGDSMWSYYDKYYNKDRAKVRIPNIHDAFSHLSMWNSSYYIGVGELTESTPITSNYHLYGGVVSYVSLNPGVSVSRIEDFRGWNILRKDDPVLLSRCGSSICSSLRFDGGAISVSGKIDNLKISHGAVPVRPLNGPIDAQGSCVFCLHDRSGPIVSGDNFFTNGRDIIRVTSFAITLQKMGE